MLSSIHKYLPEKRRRRNNIHAYMKCISIYDKYLNLIRFLKLNMSQTLSGWSRSIDIVSFGKFSAKNSLYVNSLVGDFWAICIKRQEINKKFWKHEKLSEHIQIQKKSAYIFHIYHLKNRFFIFFMVSLRLIAGQRHRMYLCKQMTKFG